MNVLAFLTKLAFCDKPNIVGKERGFKATAMSPVPLGPLLHTHLADPHNKEIQQTIPSFNIEHLTFFSFFLFYPHGGPSQKPPSSQQCLFIFKKAFLRRILQLNHVDIENRASNPTSRQIRCSTKEL